MLENEMLALQNQLTIARNEINKLRYDGIHMLKLTILR